ncbi:GspE/PulE family protein [Alienimonas sp. DA493]|uniref:GspE/PulE family protein n=1 Tax=Alienimonas sp. DA493 TaxID=3373605 RepID=UPI00375417DC
MDLGAMLARRGLLTADQLEAARAGRNGRRVDQAAVDLGMVSEQAALAAIGDELGYPFIDLKDFEIEEGLLERFPAAPIFRHTLLPLYEQNGRVVVATSDPFDLEGLDELSSLSGLSLIPALARREDIAGLIKAHLGVGGDTVSALVARREEEGVELLEELGEDLGEEAEEAQAASVIKLVNELLVEALDKGASDIHVEPGERGLTIRFRIDGVLRIQPMPPEITHFQNAMITRLKIMSRLNIAEKRRPQDGRIQLRVKGREIDVRVSIIPMIHGEGIVMRLLDKSRMTFDLKNVGMPPNVIEPFRQACAQPNGIILVTGPTGSGKSSTLYSALNEIKSPEVKVITVEDPVEYQSEGISQIQVHSKVGLTFAAGLRSILRHDPDVVLIGEIRDGETAQAAIQASLTGHLVFSTLHTNDAPGSFTRLIDMGVESYLVASTVEAILAQRLVRKLCPDCKREYDFDPRDLPPGIKGEPPATLWKAVGCRACGETGYRGRTGIFELLISDDELRQMVSENAPTDAIRRHGRKNGMTTLRDSGWQRCLSGETSLEEVVRVTKGDMD